MTQTPAGGGPTEATNPEPGDPAGASAPGGGLRDRGDEQLLDGGSTGTEEGPAGIPAALVGHDADGDPVPPPPAARPDEGSTSTGPAEESDALSPSDHTDPQRVSGGRSQSSGGTPGMAPPASSGAAGPPV